MTKELKVKVGDIPCTGCAEDMEIFLRDQDGVLEVKVDYADHIINIIYDSDEVDYPTVVRNVRKVANISKIISD